jgi:S-adenosylmethionine hydrolase
VIYLFTDFGWGGPYVGEMKAVLARCLPGACLIDLMHDAPRFNAKASAYLLAALGQRFQAGDVCLGVVDPGVGDQNRRAIFLEANGVHYVGPDNGLFAVLARRAQQVECREILWRPAQYSSSFHGRDIFAPVICRLQSGTAVEVQSISIDSLVGAGEYTPQLAEVIYIDDFGNAVTGLNAAHVHTNMVCCIQEQRIHYAETFSSTTRGGLFWYVNSMGLIEIAANQASAGELLGLSIGTSLRMEN